MSLARPMTSLSVIIITKNEAKNITACLESVKFADEIIVLDSGSTDETVQICLRYTQAVFQVDWPGYGEQKNRAIQKCNKDWVFSIDADEVVSQELAKAIQKVISMDNSFNAYSIRRKSTYCHQFMYHGDWRNDYSIRLFRRKEAKFKALPVHEELIVNGKIGVLKEPLLHYSFTNLEEVLNKLNHYSTLGAEYKQSQGKKSSLFKAITHSAWTFLRGYLLRGGFLDGKKGFMLAVSNAEGCYYRYLKLMLLEENSFQ